MQFLSRRDFLRDSALLSGGLASVASLNLAAAEETARAAKKENDKLRVACVGVRGQGLSHVRGYANRHGCLVTTICDVDEAVIKRAMDHVTKEQGKAPTYVKDIRKVVEDKDIDLISIATPNHWHA